MCWRSRTAARSRSNRTGGGGRRRAGACSHDHSHRRPRERHLRASGAPARCKHPLSRARKQGPPHRRRTSLGCADRIGGDHPHRSARAGQRSRTHRACRGASWARARQAAGRVGEAWPSCGDRTHPDRGRRAQPACGPATSKSGASSAGIASTGLSSSSSAPSRAKGCASRTARSATPTASSSSPLSPPMPPAS